MAGNSASFHESPDNLSAAARDMHRALVSLQEELEAVDWYQQRAEACDDDALKEILLHNMREEIEHAAMLLEWLRRRHSGFEQHLHAYLFTSQPILDIEEEDTGEERQTEAELKVDKPHDRELTVGPMKGD